MVGPAGIAHFKEIKDLATLGTVACTDVSSYLSHSSVSHALAAFQPLAHSIYEGRRHLGRYSQAVTGRYAAFDANGVLLGEFSHTKDAYEAVTAAASEAAR